MIFHSDIVSPKYCRIALFHGLGEVDIVSVGRFLIQKGVAVSNYVGGWVEVGRGKEANLGEREANESSRTLATRTKLSKGDIDV